MKQIGKTLLAAVLLLSLLTVSALAEGDPRLEISSAAAAPGDQVSLTVSIADNPGYAGFDMQADYDAAVLELTQFTLTRVSGALSSTSVNTGKATFATLRQETGDGVIATLSFRVRDDAPAGETSVGVKNVSFFDIDENEIDVQTIYGSVTVTGTDPGSEPVPAEATEAPDTGTTPSPEGEEPLTAKEETHAAEEDTPAQPAETDATQPVEAAADEPTVRETETPALPEALERTGVDPERTIVYEITPPAEERDDAAFGFTEVTVPYPAKTAGGNYVYRAYMLGEDGAVEELPVTETEEGLSVMADADYPFSLSWMTPEEAEALEKAAEQEEAPAEAESAPAPTPEPAPAAEAPSGAGHALAWVLGAVAVCAAAVVVVLVLRRRRKG